MDAVSRFTRDTSCGLEMIAKAVELGVRDGIGPVTVTVTAEVSDTNPDAAVAEAAQEASKHQGYGPDDTRSEIEQLRDAIKGRTRLVAAAVREEKEKRVEMTRQRDVWRERMAVCSSDLRKQLDAMTKERDAMSKERDELVIAARDHCPNYDGQSAQYWFGCSEQWQMLASYREAKTAKQATLIKALREWAIVLDGRNVLARNVGNDREITALDKVEAAEAELKELT